MKHLKYLKGLLRHKWFVFLECFKRGIAWRGIMHDISKFGPKEWFPYVEHFYGSKKGKIDPDFDYAWLHHQKRNPHHWQYWILKDRALEMKEPYRTEMLCDWIGANKAYKSKQSIFEWFKENKDSMILGPETIAYIEEELESL